MGKLVVVPTPVGNMQDMTFRAVEVLKQADLILAEDTRTSGNLLKHFGIETKMIAHHKFNEHATLGRTLDIIRENSLTALISDAGTPSISDPGYLITKNCIENDIEVECLPGATAFVPALVMSGFTTDRFCFEGFLPHKKGRQTRLLALKDETRTIIFYESPHRVVKTLTQIQEFIGERNVAVVREISKIYQEVVRGSIPTVIKHFQEKQPKGEFVLLVAGKDDTINLDEEEE
ncbi:MAG: 16S rRNA (cytidine(1402)-2'-O)-methyltransferase [Bacteroidales bacterium]|nr:16S rRNA (cytidine(1402)-2'-O)-methyltransferase [Bacteroidales bacterium]MBR6266391.1 16S rRNA (cytidine(1402)-2'-O)-methyltransferase [Bacteroidales bacterium]